MSTRSFRTQASSQGSGAGERVLEEAVEGDVRAAHEVDPAVEVRPLRGGVEAELPHAEAGHQGVPSGGRGDLVEERVLGGPEVGVGHRHRLAHRPGLPRRQDQGLGAPPGTPPVPAFHVWTRWSRSNDAGAAPRLVSFVSTRISDEAIRGATCTHSITGLSEKWADDLVVDARRPPELLEVGPRGVARGQHPGVRPDPDHQDVLRSPLDGVAHVEEAGGEAARVLADLPAVQPDRGPELGLVHPEGGHRLPGRGGERPPVPEVVALLPRHPGRLDPRRLGQAVGQVLGADAIGDELRAVEGVHVREGRRRVVDQAGHRHRVAEARRAWRRPRPSPRSPTCRRGRG